MSTLIERIREVMAAQGWDNPQQVADVAGVSRSAAAQWLGQGSKLIHSIGNMEAAENLERQTGFAALWIAKGIGPKHVKTLPRPATDWPLPAVSEEKVRGLSKQDLVKLQDAMLIAATVAGLDIKK